MAGIGSKFLARVGTLSGRRHFWAFDCQHPALQGYTRVKLFFPRDFPAAELRIMVDEALCLVLPHVEEPADLTSRVVVRHVSASAARSLLLCS
jgi:hypothetical protein